jgi:hypothetical protein
MTIAFPIEETTRATTAPNPQSTACTCGALRDPACTCGASDTPPRKLPLSEKRLAANRANAQKSTGPRTTEGKATVSKNATTHGLTSTTPPPLADPAYSLRLYELKEEHRPTTPSQHYLVEQLAHIGWKLEQIPQIEAHLLAQQKAQAQPSSDSSFIIQNSSFPSLFAQDLLSEKPTPLTRLWDLHRRLLAQFQSILRQLPQLKKQAQRHEDQDEEQSKFEKDLDRGERLDRFLKDLPAHNARCDAARRAQYNLPDPTAQIKPTPEISNPQISDSPPSQIKPTAPLSPHPAPDVSCAQNQAHSTSNAAAGS